jgi:DNA-binding response OmpR family regulator
MVTRKGEEAVGLEAGADGYLTKPFSPENWSLRTPA